MRHRGGAMLLVCLAASWLAQPAEAASPASASMSRPRQKVSWSGTFQVANPTGAIVFDDPCQGTAGCDHFKLRLNMGEGAIVKVRMPAPDAKTDIDVYVYDPKGKLVSATDGAQGFFGESEAFSFKHAAKFRNKPYDVAVVPFFVTPGTKYKATAQVTKYVR